jgi:methyl-accepting chemotaxis protein
MKLMAKFNLILLVIFATGGFALARIANSFLIEDARSQVMQEAQLMLASASSVRQYTADQISPLLQQNPRHRVHFLPQTVPFYGATSTFNDLRKSYPDYSYREAALNPTNPEDRATDWESDIIYQLRDHPGKDQTGVRQTASGPALYIAQPIVATHDCLECHSTPSAAPVALRAVYGATNGFGWKENEIIGAQIVAVPMAVPIANAQLGYHRLILFLTAVMLLTVATLDMGVYWFVIRPLKLVSDAADRVSRGEKFVPAVQISGHDEIATVAASFNRMQVSLAKALRMVDED